MGRWLGLLVALPLALASAGCGRAAAQETKGAWEHGVFEWIHLRAAKGDEERYTWTTAAEEIQRETATGFYGAVGIDAILRRSSADRVFVVDHLAKGGWELVNRTDVAYVDAGGSAIAERYILRRRR